jgi:prevent-host-death family protein
MDGLSASEFRKDMAAALNRVAFGGERVVIARNRKPVAALISADDLALLEAMEAYVDKEDLKRARRTRGKDVPWEELEREITS